MKSFEVQIDASDFALGGVLTQEEHPIAFESQKLKCKKEVHISREEIIGRSILHEGMEARPSRIKVYSQNK